MSPRARRHVALLPPVLALAVGLAGCGGAPEVVATAGCDAPVTPLLQEGSHLLGDTAPPVPYSSSPPTSGWHASGAPPQPGVHGTPVSDPRLVLWLEDGGAYLAHGPDVPAAALVEAAATYPELLVTRYDGPLDGPVVLAAWGVLQVCDDVDLDAIGTFLEATAQASSGH